MGYAVIGFGAVGQALARAFARQHIEVAVASRRPPDALAPQAQAIGSTVVPKTLREAIKAGRDYPGRSVLGTSGGRQNVGELAGQDDH
jgi:predicted dinucleotide-binding enzyme